MTGKERDELNRAYDAISEARATLLIVYTGAETYAGISTIGKDLLDAYTALQRAEKALSDRLGFGKIIQFPERNPNHAV